MLSWGELYNLNDLLDLLKRLLLNNTIFYTAVNFIKPPEISSLQKLIDKLVLFLFKRNVLKQKLHLLLLFFV